MVKILEEIVKDHLENPSPSSHDLEQQDDTVDEQEKAIISSPDKSPLIRRSFLFRPETVQIITELPESGDICQVIVKNSLKDFADVIISVSHISEFFSENVLSEAIGMFQAMEQLVFDIPREDETRSYIIEVRSGKKKVAIKKVDIPAMTA